MTKAVLVLLLMTIVASLKLREAPSPSTDSNSTMNMTKDDRAKTKPDFKPNTKIKVNGTSIELENCEGYGVNAMFINFGCTVCKSGSKLLADHSGIGICQKETGIANCDKSIQFTTKSSITCLECTDGMALSKNGGKCKKLDIDIAPEGNATELIPNCRQYAINSIGKITCNKCITGFSLSNDHKNCDTKCTITNCDNCFENGFSQHCYHCLPGYVGIIGYPFNTVSKCINAKEWMDNLFAPLVREFILD